MSYRNEPRLDPIRDRIYSGLPECLCAKLHVGFTANAAAQKIEQLPLCGNCFGSLLRKLHTWIQTAAKRPHSAQGIGGARSHNRIAVVLLEFARSANSILVSSVEFCLRQNSRSKSAKRIYDRNPRKARFFAEQKMRPNEVVKKPPASVGSL
jgi:hypothetical protein